MTLNLHKSAFWGQEMQQNIVFCADTSMYSFSVALIISKNGQVGDLWFILVVYMSEWFSNSHFST